VGRQVVPELPDAGEKWRGIVQCDVCRCQIGQSDRRTRGGGMPGEDEASERGRDFDAEQ